MNILIFTIDAVNPSAGGIQKVSYTLYNKFKKNHQCFICSFRNNASTQGLEAYFLPDKNNIGSKQNLDYMYNLLIDNNIDVIINNTYILLAFYFLLEVKRKINFKLITVIHNDLQSKTKCLLDEFECLKFQNKGARLLIKQLYHIIKYPIGIYKRRKSFNTQLLYMYNNSDAFVLLSDNIKLLFNKMFKNVDQSKLYAIPNPLEFTEYDNCTIKKNQIVFIGRLDYQKRLDRILDLWKEVYKDFPFWNLIIIGDGESRKSMEDYSKKNKLSNYQFIGKQVALPYLKESKIMCMSSTHEGFGMVLIEAQQYGCVPIVYNSFSSASDIIDDGKTGFLIKPFNKSQFVEKLRLLMKDEDKRKVMENMSILSSSRFDIDKISNQWEMLFEKIV